MIVLASEPNGKDQREALCAKDPRAWWARASDQNRKARCRRILVAEDDPELRALLVESLLAEGYEVMPCPDGLELMETLSAGLADDQMLQLDLIVSDIRMPWVTGLDVLRGMRDFVGYPPVILMTAFGDNNTHREAASLGAAVVLDKPFEIDFLLEKVRELLPPDSKADG